jgi:hypothetical protein
MVEITTIGIDLAKNVFQVHGVDASGVVVVRKAMRRAQVLSFQGSAALGWAPEGGVSSSSTPQPS